ncbi:hypothetical protein [Deinococcus arcticus]|uniref:Uncharacterized protein n=1 Tax=Deinococcus arcticus TaxID=2136176 RepID=A0A2T3W503_9DEIO|nr:hypothetical protein [Deinococcus arcticus]PTA66952.1 hypothetical protein C8263_15405 [Deinococcus arcticus]
MPDEEKGLAGQSFDMDASDLPELSDDELLEIAELFPPDPAYLRKRMAVEAMHEAGQFIDPNDFDVD